MSQSEDYMFFPVFEDNIFPMIPEITPLDCETYLSEEMVDVEMEISELNKEIASIAIDTIPFNKTDVIVIFAVSMIEVALDFFIADPNFDDSLASKCNDGKSGIGKWLNKIHEKIDHKNNPLDNQGAFDEFGNFIKYGESGAYPGQKISFGGPDHRPRTYGHDLLRFFSAIKQIKDGQFRDGGFIDGVYHEVASNISQTGVEYASMSWPKAIWEYVCHMFADFFSSKGLPCPGWSFLSHADDREIRQMADDIYRDGMNLRTEFLKSVAVTVADLLCRGVHYIRYRKDERYSDEAKAKKLNLTLLLSHGIAMAVNIGKVAVTENPASLNIPMMVRVLQLAFTAMKDQMNLNQRAIAKLDLTIYRNHLQMKQTLIVVMRGVYYTSNIQDLTQRLIDQYRRKVEKRMLCAYEIIDLGLEYELAKRDKRKLLNDNQAQIMYLSSTLDVSDASFHTGTNLLQDKLLKDEGMQDMDLGSLLNKLNIETT